MNGELSQLVNLTFEADTYIAYIGDSVKLTCQGSNLSPADVVWIVYLISDPLHQRVVYSESTYIGNSSRKYSIESELISESTQPSTRTSLTIYDVQDLDVLYGYQCVCNIYKRCSNTNHAKANSTLIAISLSTNVTTRIYLYFS